jgi:hypothetical protein
MGGIISTHLVEDGLGLTTVSALLAIITTLSLGEQRGLAGLVLRNLVLRVCPVSVFATITSWMRLTLLAVPALAVGSASLGNVDLARYVSHVAP